MIHVLLCGSCVLQEKLRAAYMAVAQTLGREGIMYVQAEAGVFVMLDLREFLEDSTQVRSSFWQRAPVAYFYCAAKAFDPSVSVASVVGAWSHVGWRSPQPLFVPIEFWAWSNKRLWSG